MAGIYVKCVLINYQFFRITKVQGERNMDIRDRWISLLYCKRPVQRKEMEAGIPCKIKESIEALEGVNRLHYVTNCHKYPIDIDQLIE